MRDTVTVGDFKLLVNTQEVIFSVSVSDDF
jgi:hypothetical protein